MPWYNTAGKTQESCLWAHDSANWSHNAGRKKQHLLFWCSQCNLQWCAQTHKTEQCRFLGTVDFGFEKPRRQFWEPLWPCCNGQTDVIAHNHYNVSSQLWNSHATVSFIPLSTSSRTNLLLLLLGCTDSNCRVAWLIWKKEKEKRIKIWILNINIKEGKMFTHFFQPHLVVMWIQATFTITINVFLCDRWSRCTWHDPTWPKGGEWGACRTWLKVHW